jgi:hypothetical protein
MVQSGRVQRKKKQTKESKGQNQRTPSRLPVTPSNLFLSHALMKLPLIPPRRHASLSGGESACGRRRYKPPESTRRRLLPSPCRDSCCFPPRSIGRCVSIFISLVFFWTPPSVPSLHWGFPSTFPTDPPDCRDLPSLAEVFRRAAILRLCGYSQKESSPPLIPSKRLAPDNIDNL